MKDNTTNSNIEEVTFKDLILTIKGYKDYLFSQFKVIVLVALFGSILGVAYSFIKKPLYTATLTFALEDEGSSGLGGALGLVGQFGFDVGGSGGGVFEGSNIIELFKSRSMVEKTLLRPVKFKGDTISLAEMYIANKQWRKKWAGKTKLETLKFSPNSSRDNFTRVQDSILEIIYKDLSKSGLSVLQQDKKISIITVEVKSTDEVFSKAFSESLAKVVSDFYIYTKSKKAQINMTILQRQLDSIRGELNGSLTGVAVAKDRTFNLNPALNVKRVPSVRKEVDVQANTAILTELVKQTELAKVTLRKETPLIQIIDKPIYPLKKDNFGIFKGIILGGFLGGFAICFYLIIKRILGSLGI